MGQGTADKVAAVISKTVNSLAVCAVAMDAANQSLPNELTACPDGSDYSAVYYGCAEIVREVMRQLDKLQDEF